MFPRSEKEEDKYIQGQGGEVPQYGRPLGQGRRQQQQQRRGGEGWYNDDAINDKNYDEEGQNKIGDYNGGKKK